MASKWKLNKAEEKQLEKEGSELMSQKLTEGLAQKDAKAAKDDHIRARTQELKQAKFEANKLKKQTAGQVDVSAKAKPKAKTTKPVTQSLPQVSQQNTAYYTKLIDALDVIQTHPVFARIAEADPLKIDGSNGVQVC